MMRPALILSLFIIATSTGRAEVANDPFAVQPLLPGQSAPGFTMTDAHGEAFEFVPTGLERPALIIFYRGGWCPYCNLHLAELRKIEDQLTAHVDLMFLSADQPAVLAEAVADGEVLDYALLSDADSEIAQAFGIAFRVDDATVEKYEEYGIDLEAASGHDHHVLPVPAVFLVGTDGVIRFQYVNPDYRIRLSPEVLVAVAQTMPHRSLR